MTGTLFQIPWTIFALDKEETQKCKSQNKAIDGDSYGTTNEKSC